MDLAYWWSCIGKGLCLQPAQQACLANKQMLFRVCLRGSVYETHDSADVFKEEAFVFKNLRDQS